MERLVWEKIDDFCNRNSLEKFLYRTTNVCSTIVLLNKQMRISFFLDEMDSYINIKVEFTSTDKENIKIIAIDDSTSDSVVTLRKMWTRSLRKKVKERYFSDLISEYIRLIQREVDEQNSISGDKR